METKTQAPTNESTEQPTEQPQQNVANESQQPLMPADCGTYIRNEDGSLTKVEYHAQS
jgi:hypothetical protein